MQLLRAEEMKEMDRRAQEEYHIPGIVLMENAGIRTVEYIESLDLNVPDLHVVIIAGRGNNGGDGLVIARHLINAAYQVELFLLGEVEQLTPDARVNYDILHKMQGKIPGLRCSADLEKLMIALLSADLVVDAIYGIGFRGSLNEFESQIVKMVNLTRAQVIAVDIPSGVEADTGRVNGEAILADHTVTFALPKIGQIFEPGKNYVGTLTVADISIPKRLLQDSRSKTHLIEESMVRRYFRPRAAESHKGTYGHALVIGGSSGMTGAVMMSALSALRAGAGLVTAAVPESLVPMIDTLVMEVMTRGLAETTGARISLEAIPALENLIGTASVCAIGPGMSRYTEANAILRFVLENAGIPVLIDADGINALQEDASILKNRQIPVIITPHPGEMARLTGLTVEEIQQNRLEVARQYALEWGITIVLKGNKTVVASPAGELFVNVTGHAGMATAGSGDVLTGIISGFLSQGINPRDAAIAGVFVHGLAGERASLSTGQRGLIAGDIIHALPDTLNYLES